MFILIMALMATAAYFGVQIAAVACAGALAYAFFALAKLREPVGKELIGYVLLLAAVQYLALPALNFVAVGESRSLFDVASAVVPPLLALTCIASLVICIVLELLSWIAVDAKSMRKTSTPPIH